MAVCDASKSSHMACREREARGDTCCRLYARTGCRSGDFTPSSLGRCVMGAAREDLYANFSETAGGQEASDSKTIAV